MVYDVEFLFDNDLIAAVQKLIRDSKKHLLLISPFIDFDERIKDALKEKINQHDFELKVLFGKNEDNFYRSIKKDSFEFLKKFPNVEIRFNERLHAKFYQNDYEFIMTSLNLYDYSLANNIESGIRSKYANKGVLGKASDVTADLIEKGIGTVKHDVLGMTKGVDPLEKFQTIYELSDIKYKTEPITSEKSGLQGLIGRKKLDDLKVVINNFETEHKSFKSEIAKDRIRTTVTTKTVITQVRCISASQIAKLRGLNSKDITRLMERKGFINGEDITQKGKEKGLVIKVYMGNHYIAYPENLQEFSELRSNQ